MSIAKERERELCNSLRTIHNVVFKYQVMESCLKFNNSMYNCVYTLPQCRLLTPGLASGAEKKVGQRHFRRKQRKGHGVFSRKNKGAQT